MTKPNTEMRDLIGRLGCDASILDDSGFWKESEDVREAAQVLRTLTELRPMEEAPRDGTRILVMNSEDPSGLITAGWWQPELRNPLSQPDWCIVGSGRCNDDYMTVEFNLAYQFDVSELIGWLPLPVIPSDLPSVGGGA